MGLAGVDQESLTDQELEAQVRSLEGVLRSLPEGFCLYQYTRVRSGYELPRQQKYAHPVTENFVSDRLEFLNETARFRRLDLHWCLTIEPPKNNPFARKPTEQAGENSRLLAELQKMATILQAHLGPSLGLKVLGKKQTFQFFSYLFNLEEWAERDHLRLDSRVDQQIVKSPISWHQDHLRVGKRYVQMFSLQTTPESSRPCLFSELMSLDCDAIVCSTWRPKSTSSARKEIEQQEKFTSFFKVGVLSRVMSSRDLASLETTAGAKAASLTVDDLSEVIRSLDKKAQGTFSLTLLVSGRSAEQLRDIAPSVHRVFVDARAQVMEETLGNGQTRALQERGMFDTQAFATAVYQSELTFRLRNLGYELETGRSGAPEIKGFTREYLEASSPRSQQIRQYLEETGFQGPAAAQIAAHETRDNKQIHSTAEVMAAHYKVAALHGHQAESIVAAARERQRSHPLERVSDAPGRSQEAVSYAKERSFEREAVSDERLLMRDALRRGMGDITYPEIRRNFDRRVEAGEFQSVEATKHATGTTFTTPETMAMERSTVRSLRLGQDATEPIMQANAAAQQALSRPQLNDGQRKAIEEILTSRDRVHGLAGTGKTTTLSVIREGAERNGYAVEGFAPTSKAANQLREAGVSADTLQGFLLRGSTGPADPASRHLYMLDESSLASTRQMRDFVAKIGPQDRVLVIGDTRQHQGVDAGKPFEQMQDAGMRTSQLDKIVRQQDPGLLAAVEKLSQNETASGVAMLQKQGRVTQVEDREQRIAAIAKDYAAKPQNTIIVSPDNASRRELNRAVRMELQDAGQVSRTSEFLPTLIPRSELTGADRQWAARYQQGDVLHYTTGSKELGIARRSYATVTSVDPENNRLTVKRQDGQEVTYDPKRLQGVSAYQEIGRDFSKGDRIQFTAPSRELGVANRDLATIEKIHEGAVTVRLDGKEQTVTFDSAKMRHFDHGYAVTSQSSQGVTAERVLVNMDTRAHPELINTRFAYVSVSRASHEAQIYTNDAAALGRRLSHDASKSSAIDFRQQEPTPNQNQQPREEKTMDVESHQAHKPGQTVREVIYRPADHERHYGPLNRELHPQDAQHFAWKAASGTIQSYQHAGTQRHIHIDGFSGQFYDQQKNPVTQHAALDHAIGAGRHHAPEPAKVREVSQQRRVENGIGFGL